MMASKCKKCGNTDNYNFALNIGLCDICIGEQIEELEELKAENKQLKKRLKASKEYARRILERVINGKRASNNIFNKNG